MLELLACKVAYCHHCRSPKFCGEFVVHGWRHSFLLCRDCLESIVDRISPEAVNANKAYMKTEGTNDNQANQVG
jgi:hypothetical protein